MTVETVEAIGATDRQRAVASLTLAFSSDPVVRWAWPDQERYLSYWPRFTEAFAGGAFANGTAHGLEDCTAVALWLAPGIESDGDTVMELMKEAWTTRPSRTSEVCSNRRTNTTRPTSTGSCR